MEFSKRGVYLILWDYNEEENKKTYDALRATGHRRSCLYKVDLTDEKQVREAAQQVKDKHGDVSILILGAASLPNTNSVLDAFKSEDDIRMFNLFYESHKWTYQEFVPKMIENKCGHLVVISSLSAELNMPYMSMYSSLKLAQVKLLECLDEEIKVNHKDCEINTSIVHLGLMDEGLTSTVSQKFHINFKSAMKAEDASKKIVKGILRNDKHINVPGYIGLITLMRALFPIQCFQLWVNPDEMVKKKIN